jgi:DNA-directed RNA polymerase III subunit RPC2
LTQQQALEYIGSKVKSVKNFGGSKNKTLADEAKDLFNNVILSHIPLAEHQMTYFAKCRYMGLMIRRVIEAIRDPKKLDDKDYYGNKRLELAGQMISLLFEDLFKRFQFVLQKQIDQNLSKSEARRESFDVQSCLYTDMIT